MKFYLLGPRGGLKPIKKLGFKDNEGYIIDDFKTLYLWLGSKVSQNLKDIFEKKIKEINLKREKSSKIEIINQNHEYGSFLAIIDILKQGLENETIIERRPELKIKYEETLELVEAGLEPDLEGEITLDAHNLAQEKKSYKELCKDLASLQLKVLRGKVKITSEAIKKKAEEIHNSSSTYEELCWLISELEILLKKKSLF